MAAVIHVSHKSPSQRLNINPVSHVESTTLLDVCVTELKALCSSCVFARIRTLLLRNMALHISPSDPSSTLHLSQKAPVLLSAAAPASQFFPLTLLEKSEAPVTWTDYEKLFQACLRAGDDRSAHLCLERLTLRFGASDNRVMGLRGMYQEAIADGTADLEEVLQSYESILQADPMNVVCRCDFRDI